MAGAGLLALTSTSSAVSPALVTNGLVYNWNASAGATTTRWTSTAPGTNTTQQWFIGSGGTALATADQSPSTLNNAAYAFYGYTTALAWGPSLNATSTNQTFEFWAKPLGLAQGKQVLFETGNESRGMAIVLDNNAVWLTMKWNGSATFNPDLRIVHYLAPWEASDFIHIAVSCSATGIKLFVNPVGELTPNVPKATFAGTVGNWTSAAGAGLAGISDGAGGCVLTSSSYFYPPSMAPFQGAVSVARVYNRPLTDAEVLQNFRAVSQRNPAVAVPITKWAEWGGHRGRGGLAKYRSDNEGMMHPQPGDVDNATTLVIGGVNMLEWREVTVGTDGSIDFLDTTKFPRVGSSQKNDGTVEQLHTYVRASTTAAVTAVVNATCDPKTMFMWLNGTAISPGDRVTLNAGWNRLMIRVCSPASSPGVPGPRWGAWTAKFSFSGYDGNTLPALTFQTFDPARRVLVTDTNEDFRYYSTLKRVTEGDQPVFVAGEAVNLRYNLRVATGAGPNYIAPANRQSWNLQNANWIYSFDPARVSANQPNVGQTWVRVPAAQWANYKPNRVALTVTNSAGAVIWSKTLTLPFGAVANGEVAASVNLDPLGALSPDLYRVYGSILDANGMVQAYDRDHSFAVMDGTPNKAADDAGKPRMIAAVGHWLLGQPEAVQDSKFRYMKRVGITRHQKLYEAMFKWGVSNSNGNITVNPAPAIDRVLLVAAANNVEVIGDLVQGYTANATTTSNLNFTGLGGGYPDFGTQRAAWDKMLYDYGFKVASRYKDRIKYWSGINEIESNYDTDRSADLHVAASNKIKEGMKAADPGAVFITSSFGVYNNLVQRLWNKNYHLIGNWSDGHAHPAVAPNVYDGNIVPDSRTGVSLAHGTPCWLGEVSAPDGRHYYGGLGGAGDLIKQISWGVKHREAPQPIGAIAYLVAYNGDDYWSYNDGFNNQVGDPLPHATACSTASKWIDGRRVLADVPLINPAGQSLNAAVEQLRVTSADTSNPHTLVLWIDGEVNNWEGGLNATCTVRVKTPGTWTRVVNIYGKHLTNIVSSGGYATVTVGPVPVILRGNFN
jgi:hypothetical protein